MTDDLSVDICVIGAGSGGLSVAAGASQMGASVALVERDRMGGDCLNWGCVPSKALLAAAHARHDVDRAGAFGIDVGDVKVDATRVRAHVQGAIDAIALNDSIERFEGLGVTVLQGSARFTGPRTVAVGDRTVTARRFVVATGARATVPPIAGLDDVPFQTNESIFALGPVPDHLIIIGGGPIGLEMADAHAGLGAKVTVLEMGTICPKDDPELVSVLRTALQGRGIDIREGVTVDAVARDGEGVRVALRTGDVVEEIIGSHLLLATGRTANVDGLDLEKAGVAYSSRGIAVDRRLRTTNKKIFAIGDVVEGAPQFTHVAGYHAGVVIKNALFRLPAKADHGAVPWVTYADPELAGVGLGEVSARKAGHDIRVLRWPFGENDRAQCEARTEGMIKVITNKKGRILGAGIVGPGAGDLIAPWVLAVSEKMNISAMASVIAPYPTRGEISKRVAGSYYMKTLFSDRTRKIVRFLARFG